MTRSLPSTRLAARIVILFILAPLAGAPNAWTQSPAGKAEGTSSNATQAAMRGIFTSLTQAYSYSRDLEFFQDRHNRDTIRASLEALVANTGALETHGGGLDPSFEYMKRYLAGDAGEALKRFNERQYMGSQFMIGKLLENCATCHSRLPAARSFEIGAEFLKEARAEAISPVDRVNIEIAARQFDAALDTYEQIFTLRNMTAEGLQLIGAFEGYLRIALGVKNDSARPTQAFTAFLKRDDMPEELRGQVRAWTDDLRTLDMSAVSREPLASSRRLVDGAAVVRRPPPQRPELVRIVAANALLHRHLRSMSAQAPEGSEVYYLLAVTESWISRSFWIFETDFLLDKAVRAAPKSEFARRALSVLEERASQPVSPGAYEGSVTPKFDLDELKRLVEG